MSDTLKSDLNDVISALLEAGLGLKSTHVAAVEKAIAELDRLEAEVKKPRLPEWWSVRIVNGAMQLLCGDQVVIGTTDIGICGFLMHFLPTPDVVPSTEPVQAAGDGERKAFDVWYESKHWLPYKFEDALREAFNGGVAWGRPITAPAETSDQGQRSQTPTKQETAEKPKPVSLEQAMKDHLGCNRLEDWAKIQDFATRMVIIDLVRELDERGV